MSNLDYDLVENNLGGLAFFIFRQEGEPESPSFSFNAEEKSFTFRRNATQSHTISLTEPKALAAFGGKKTILVIEVDQEQPDNTLSYSLPVTAI